MNELLQLCGYKEQEIESELPRVKKVFDKLGITNEDIERAKQRLTKYYDIELKGVRKILRLLLQEMVNWLLAREEGKTKIIYGFMATGFFDAIGAAAVSKSKEVYAVHLASLFHIVVGSIFGKIVPIMEASEQRWLKSGAVTHCGNVKALVGLLTLDLIPKPDLLINTGVLCETAPKALDLLQELDGIPTCCYDTCRDREFWEYPEATKRISDLMMKSSRILAKKIEEVVDFELTDAMLQEVIDARRVSGRATRKLRNLIQSSDPPPIGSNPQTLLMPLNFLPMYNVDKLSDITDAMDTLYEELQERVSRGVGIVGKGAPRIIAILPPHWTDPHLDYLVEEAGMAIVSTDMGMGLSYSDVVEWKDPYEMLSMQGVQSSLHNSLSRRVDTIVEGCKRLNVDGVLNRFHIGCRTVAGDSLIIKNAITKELGIPVLQVERDDFDPRVCNHDRYRLNLETFKAILTR
ncbi:2-hydroxyacyl-CoA dehydratase [Chloroflexota bacterium]